MSWLKKLIRSVGKAITPGNVAKNVVKQVQEAPSFFKLTGRMIEAGVINVEENIARGYRKITGKGVRKAFNPDEGPLVSTVSLQDLAALSSAVYNDDGGSRDGYDTLVTRQVKDLQFSVYRNQKDGHVVVAFRGSSNFDNWKNRNMRMRGVDDGHGNMVHEGFKSAWDDLKPAVSSELEKIFLGDQFANNVTFTGHSLGGAISQLATADYMESQNPRLIDTVHFASPTVGDVGFNERIAPGHQMRVVDPRDSVPKLVQTLQPDFVPPELSTRVIALGDKDARINERVKKDAVRFGLELSFDIGIAMLLAYAPEAEAAAEFAGVAEEGEGLIAIEEKAIASVEKSLGLGAAAEEEAIAETFIEAIGGAEGEAGISQTELNDLRNLFHPEFRENVIKQLRNIASSSIEENIVRVEDAIDWEQTIKIVMVKAGITESASNLITPFVMENVSGDINPEGVQFLLHNSFDFMYGAVRAHPVGTYIDNVHNQFGNSPDNARADMWNNYNKNVARQDKDVELVDFMTDKELDEYVSGFVHESDLREREVVQEEGEIRDEDAGDDDEETLDDEFEKEKEDRSDEGQGNMLLDDTHNLGGIESNQINGRPLEVFANRTGRKSDGSTIYSVRTENGDTLSYTGPSHPASTTTLYGNWTGIAPFANALPPKVSRTSGFGGRAFSALDTFSMAYLINSYEDGYHNKEADDMYQKRIRAAIRNGFISDAIDHNENRVANMILKQFQEKGHIFGSEDTDLTTRGNMLSELNVMSRGSLNESSDSVEGVSVNFTRGEKRKLKQAFMSSEGQQVANEIMSRTRRRLSANEVSGTNVLENGADTLDFNMRALRVLGLQNSVEYSILDNASKQLANGYKTALNVEEELSRSINDNGVPVNGVFTNPLGSSVSFDQHRDEKINLSGNEEYLKDKLVLEIVKSIL